MPLIFFKESFNQWLLPYTFRPSLKYVRLGDLDYETNNVGAHQFKVIEKFIHPSYSINTKYEDIALLRIDGPIEFNEFIRPVCLTDPNMKISEHLVVAGWGRSDFRGTIHTHLQRIQKTFVPNAECQGHYMERITSRTLKNGIINRTQICAGSKEGEPEDCQVIEAQFHIKTLIL